MPALSLAMIVRNEEKTIERALRYTSIYADDIVICDTGSTDNTRAIASKFKNVRVITFPWCDDFSEARNFAFAHAKYDWVMWLDADEFVTQQHANRIAALRRANLLGTVRFITQHGELQYERERIVNRNHGKWVGHVHEYFDDSPSIYTVRSDIVIHHDPILPRINPDRNLRIYQSIPNDELTPRDKFYYANELFDNGMYTEACLMYGANLDLFYDWEKYYALTRMQWCHNYRNLDYLETGIEAVLHSPSRAEGYISIGYNYYARKDYKAAITFFLAATGCVKPDISGFINTADYTYLPWDYLGTCYGKIGLYVNSLEAYRKSMELGNPDKDRIDKNLEYASHRIKTS